MSGAFKNYFSAVTPPIICGLLMLAGCKPSDILRPDSPEASSPEKSEKSEPQETTSRTLQIGIWRDGKGNTWEIGQSGSTLEGIATAGPSLGLRIHARQTPSAHTLNIGTDDQPGLGVGTLQFLGREHAYFEFDGEMAAHGLFHINHENDEETCHQTGSRKSPTDLRPPRQEEG